MCTTTKLRVLYDRETNQRNLQCPLVRASRDWLIIDIMLLYEIYKTKVRKNNIRSDGRRPRNVFGTRIIENKNEFDFIYQLL